MVDSFGMGVYQSNFRFEGPLPDLDAVRDEVRRRLGSPLDGIYGLEVEGQTVEATSMLDPFTHPIVCAVLQELGGQPVSVRDGQPIASEAPAWAHKPIREMAWSDRMAIRYRWWAWFIGAAWPRRK